MDEQISEMKGMIKQAVAAGMKRLKDGRFAKKQASSRDANAALRDKFKPKGSDYKLEPARAMKAQLAIDKAKV